MAGRHRQHRAGLPPVLAALTCVAALATTAVLVQPAAAPDTTLRLPEPAPPATPPPAAPATTAPPSSAPVTVLVAPVMRTPAVTTTKPAPATPPPPATTRTTPPPTPTATAKPKAAAVDTTPAANAKCAGLGVGAAVRHVCDVVMAAVPGVTVVGGVGARPGNPTSCHPLGLALDFMTYRDKALGDRLYAYVKAHKAQLGVTTLLWQVPDHWDHVHVSLLPCLH